MRGMERIDGTWSLLMRTLKRNARPIYFANFEGMEPVLDDNGYETGNHEVSYSEPMLLMANVSASKGEADTRAFGEHVVYDKRILFSGMSPLTETSVLWIDCVIGGKIPQTDGVDVPWDYEVTRVAESLESTNHTLVAVKKVNVSFSKIKVLSATSFIAFDKNGIELTDLSQEKIYAIGKMLYDKNGNQLTDNSGNILRIGSD